MRVPPLPGLTTSRGSRCQTPPAMEQYSPVPTTDQLRILGEELGRAVSYERRIRGGLGGTVDVVSADGEPLILKRYWVTGPEEQTPAETEFRAMQLANESGVPAPTPVWIDRKGLFPEGAVVMTYVDGVPLLDAADQLDWARQLAAVLVSIHQIQPEPSDSDLFPRLAPGEGPHPEEENPETGAGHELGPRLWALRSQAAAFLLPEEPVFLHHDFWAGNTLWRQDELVAVIDWEGGCIGDPSMDVAYCAFDMRLLGLDTAADHLVDVYRQLSGRGLENFRYWEIASLYRPMPDVGAWIPSWEAMGFAITAHEARERHTSMIVAALSDLD